MKIQGHFLLKSMTDRFGIPASVKRFPPEMPHQNWIKIRSPFSETLLMKGFEPRELSTYPTGLVTPEVASQISVKESSEATVITLKWSRASGSLMLLLAAGANLICAYEAQQLQAQGSTLSGNFQAQLWMLMGLHAISLVLSYTGLAQIFNRTTIKISRGELQVRTLPLMTLMNGSVDLKEKEIGTIGLHRYTHWDGLFRYHLLARTQNGTVRAMIFGLAEAPLVEFISHAVNEARRKWNSTTPTVVETPTAVDSNDQNDTSKAA